MTWMKAGENKDLAMSGWKQGKLQTGSLHPSCHSKPVIVPEKERHTSSFVMQPLLKFNYQTDAVCIITFTISALKFVNVITCE